MVKKKDEENKDLTRIEDLSEFLHQKDSDLDTQFDNFSPELKKDLSSTGISLDASDDRDAPPEIPFDIPAEETEKKTEEKTEEESSFEVNSIDEISFEESDESPSEFSFENNSFGDSSLDENLFEGSIDESDENSGQDFIGSSNNPMESSSDAFAFDSSDELADVEIGTDDTYDGTPEPETYTNTSERFDDVKTFANNFSYGQIQGGGNPPYSIIVRHIKFKEEADDIVNILKEFGIVTDVNEKDTLMAIELGSLIIPQISEYTAIILAHKLRRFDLDLEVGLSDEVHPSKSGESNPRGLLKKDNLKQNKTESLKISELDNSIKDIIVSTMSSIQGYNVESYIGVQTTFSIVEEAELERLQYVQRSHRENSELYDFENTETTEITSEKAFKDYQNSFSLLYEDLTMQLKQKAFAQNANALLGLSFQLSPLNFERERGRVSAYQITCSATLAIISRENA
ncbi:MAG: hypothetical protein H7336_10460 [Bacteriovorax sp.]|nr:hypothetical protein [Bacteriovorax sp.]